MGSFILLHIFCPRQQIFADNLLGAKDGTKPQGKQGGPEALKEFNVRTVAIECAPRKMECSPRKSIYDMWAFMTVYSIIDDNKLHEILL